MADLIDRQAALESVCAGCVDADFSGSCPNPCVEYMLVRELPAVDAVEVVRCKDCVNGTLCINLNGAEYVDCVLDDYSIRKPDGFCSYGERRSEE